MKIAPIVLVAGLLLVWAGRAAAEIADGIQAIVHDSAITRYDVDRRMEQTVGLAYRDYGNQPALFEKKLEEMRGENVTNLIQRQLILHEFKTAGYSLPESVIDDLVQQDIKARFGDRKTMAKTLDQEGISYERYRQTVRERFIVEQLRLKNISQEIIISPHKVETYYLAHRDDFKVEDEVKLRMIVLDKSASDTAPNAEKLADEIVQQLKGGASFPEMAAVYSQDSTRSDGGEWGWKEKSALRSELAEEAGKLKPGEHSGVIETEKTCYIMEVQDTRPAHIKPLSQVRELIERNLQIEERNRLEKQWIDRLWKKTFVRFL